MLDSAESLETPYDSAFFGNICVIWIASPPSLPRKDGKRGLELPLREVIKLRGILRKNRHCEILRKQNRGNLKISLDSAESLETPYDSAFFGNICVIWIASASPRKDGERE